LAVEKVVTGQEVVTKEVKMAGTTEPGKDYPGSLKLREFLDKLRNYKLLKKSGLSSSSRHNMLKTIWYCLRNGAEEQCAEIVEAAMTYFLALSLLLTGRTEENNNNQKNLRHDSNLVPHKYKPDLLLLN
jgi:hypothetical protein